MELLSLGSNKAFFGEKSVSKTISKAHICAALKAREKGASEVIIKGKNLAEIKFGETKKKVVKYYTCQETSDNQETGRKGNKLPWYQTNKQIIEKLKADRSITPPVEEIVLLYWAKNKHSYSVAFPLDEVTTQWPKGEKEGKYRLNFSKVTDEKTRCEVYQCSLADPENVCTMMDDGARQIGGVLFL